MSGLDAVGASGGELLKEALTNCTDPLTAIEEFQVQNGILLDSLRPALPFLDLHDVQRLEFHNSVMEELRDKLLQRVDELAASNERNRNKVLNDLLTKSFPAIKIKTLQPVVMGIMKHIPKIKQEYLDKIVSDQSLYQAAAVEIKQQIWQDNQAMFGDEVSPLLHKYIDNKENSLFSHESLSQTFFALSPKHRRQDAVLIELTKLIGKNVVLFDMTLQFLRTLFLRSRNVHYCTLRAELLMTLHDLEVNDIVSVDPCHKFAWCLDACIRERYVDSKRAKELQGFLDSIRKGHEMVLGDLSMILCDPYAVHTITMSAIKLLQECAACDMLPRNNDEFVFLLRMLSMGLNAWNMIDRQHFKEIKMDVKVVTKVMPLLLSFMVDDQIQSLNSKFTEQAEPIQDALVDICPDSSLVATAIIYYTVNAIRLGNITAVTRILPALAKMDSDSVYQDTLLHLLITHLAQVADHFSNLDLIGAVFDQFFLPNLSREPVLRHILRLLWWVHHKIPSARLDAFIKMLEPNNEHTPAVHKMYQVLVEKVNSYQPSPATEPDRLDSPLMSVPAPTPAPM